MIIFGDNFFNPKLFIMSSQIKVGDCVRLNSHDECMTVLSINGVDVECQYKCLSQNKYVIMKTLIHALTPIDCKECQGE